MAPVPPRRLDGVVYCRRELAPDALAKHGPDDAKKTQPMVGIEEIIV